MKNFKDIKEYNSSEIEVRAWRNMLIAATILWFLARWLEIKYSLTLTGWPY